MYSMGRDRVLPRRLGGSTRRGSPRSRDPRPDRLHRRVGIGVGLARPRGHRRLRLYRRDRHRRHRPGLPCQLRGADPLLLALAGAQRGHPRVLPVARGARPALPAVRRQQARSVLPVQPGARTSSWSGWSPASRSSSTTAPRPRRRSPPWAASSPRTTCRWTTQPESLLTARARRSSTRCEEPAPEVGGDAVDPGRGQGGLHRPARAGRPGAHRAAAHRHAARLRRGRRALRPARHRPLDADASRPGSPPCWPRPRAGVLVVHVQNAALPGRRSDSPAQIRFNMRMHQAASG